MFTYFVILLVIAIRPTILISTALIVIVESITNIWCPNQYVTIVQCAWNCISVAYIWSIKRYPQKAQETNYKDQRLQNCHGFTTHEMWKINFLYCKSTSVDIHECWFSLFYYCYIVWKVNRNNVFQEM